MSIFSKYYKEDIDKFIKNMVPRGSSVWLYKNESKKEKFDYIILENTLANTQDVQKFLKSIKRNCHEKTRIVTIYFNLYWKPILDLAEILSLKEKSKNDPNWLSTNDITNLFSLEDFEVIKSGKRMLLPIPSGLFSSLINKFVSQLPIVNRLCLTTYQIFRPRRQEKKYSVSLVIPARNEEGNIRGILKKLPNLGKKMEVVFVEGHSNDKTVSAIKKEIKNNPQIKSYLYKQRGKGKADAVRLGFKKAKNDILIILDADLTVNPKDLTKFYDVLSKGKCDFANGSRLVYPMEEQAMKILNFYGNKFFSMCFTYLLGQNINDTLCGTKALFKKDYERIVKIRKYFGDFDPFGDFDLLFGATKLNLAIKEIPIRYGERTYGTTNISRFVHGWLLIKMTLFAAKKIKYI